MTPTMQAISLTTTQQTHYHNSGYVILPGIFSPHEVEAWRTERNRLMSLELISPLNLRSDFREMGGVKILERLDPIIDVSPVFDKLAHDPRLTMPVADVLGEPPCLFKDKIVFKKPGVDGYPMHQDAAWWQGFPVGDILSVAIAIDRANINSGAMQFFPGYHELLSKAGAIRHMTPDEATKVDLSRRVDIELKSGDAVLFSTYVPHQSGRNSSARCRSTLFFTYAAQRHGDLYGACLKQYQKHNRPVGSQKTAYFFFR